MKGFYYVLGIIAVVAIVRNFDDKPKDPENRTYESSYNSSSTATATVEDDPYINNRLNTGNVPYSNQYLSGDGSSIVIRTSSSSSCDLVAIVKKNGSIVKNAYICAGNSYTFSVPNGTYQVFFYGGKGWNPNKTMPNGIQGGFVSNESYSKDNPITLDYEEMTYELIPQQNGNFTTRQSSGTEIF
jgi:hypothetical protein